MDWRIELENFIDKNTVIIGVGSELKSDDRVGIYITESLKEIKGLNVIVAGPTPEHWLGFLANRDFKKVLIIDAVVSSNKKGEIRIFDINEISKRFGLTHSSSLHLFSDYISSEGSVEEIKILAIEPETLDLGEKLSPEVKRNADEIIKFFKELSISR
ncbi:MAG: hydrogenase maturation protease [candidate division WOR-3 bacterium]|nr:hydrogenase maturation protease [candidate division WOR-3 bacterium]